MNQAAAGFSAAAGSAVVADTLEQWYTDRIQSEGYWRTFARILSDSDHACSSKLHAEALGATGSAWRYYFAYSTAADIDFGATHGGDESWYDQQWWHRCGAGMGWRGPAQRAVSEPWDPRARSGISLPACSQLV
jgi:hypothetical protein